MGLKVRFTHTNSLLQFLTNGRHRGTRDKRLASFTKPTLLILDGPSYRTKQRPTRANAATTKSANDKKARKAA